MNSSKTGLASSPMLLNTYIEDITTESFDGTIRLVNRLILGENKKKSLQDHIGRLKYEMKTNKVKT